VNPDGSYQSCRESSIFIAQRGPFLIPHNCPRMPHEQAFHGFSALDSCRVIGSEVFA
jgi:hypothetical protein